MAKKKRTMRIQAERAEGTAYTFCGKTELVLTEFDEHGPAKVVTVVMDLADLSSLIDEIQTAMRKHHNRVCEIAQKVGVV